MRERDLDKWLAGFDSFTEKDATELHSALENKDYSGGFSVTVNPQTGRIEVQSNANTQTLLIENENICRSMRKKIRKQYLTKQGFSRGQVLRNMIYV